MAKIPSISPQVRLQMAPNTLQDTSAARQGGENIIAASKIVSTIANSVDEYMAKKQEVDDSIALTSYKQKLHERAIQAEFFARTNPEAAQDGGSVQTDFDSVYEGAREEINAIPDRRLRAKALEISGSIESQYKNKLLGYQVTKHNDSLFEQGNEALNGISFRVQNDPSQLAQALADVDELAKAMPLELKDGASFAQTARKDVVMSALDAHVAQGNYEGAVKALNTTQAGAFFSREERVKLTDSIMKRKFNVLNEKYKIESMEHYSMKRERQEIQDNNAANLYKGLFEAKTPAEKVSLLTKAQDMLTKQLIDRPTYNALVTGQERIDSRVSDDLRSNYLVQYYKGTPMESIKNNVISEMQAGRMSHDDGFGLINNMLTQSKKAASNPEYKKQMQQANEYIRASVPMTARGFQGIAMHGQTDKQMMVEINAEMDRIAQQDASMNPLDAAKLATAKVIGLSSLVHAPDRRLSLINNDPKLLTEYAQKLAKNLQDQKKLGTLSKETEKKIIGQLKEADIRIKALKYREEYEQLTNITVGIPKKEAKK